MLLDGSKICDRYDPCAANANVLIGIRDQAEVRDGQISLSHKDNAVHCHSTAEFVSCQPQAAIDEWRARVQLAAEADAPFRGHTIVVEDASPDTCLTLVALALRLEGKSLPETWVDYSARWEQGYIDTTGAPRSSYGALLGALTHVDLQRPDALADALCKAVAYTVGLIELNVEPANLPRVLTGAGQELHLLHAEAHARLAYEEVVYRRVMESATKIQLAVHMQGSTRRTLVDAILFSEVFLTSTLKIFLRSDQSGFTRQGFSFMGLFRPEQVGSGYDMTVSTDPAASLSLKALWYELERLEERRWSEFNGTPNGFPRPRGDGKDRTLPSHGGAPPSILPCHQPWYDEMGKASIVAAPRFVEHDGIKTPGSKLKWADVKAAIWRCYAPTLGLRLCTHSSPDLVVSLTDATQESAALRRSLGPGSGLYLSNVKRANVNEDDVVLWSPTLSAACAAFVDSGVATIDNLPPASAFDQIEDRGGVVFVTRKGAMLIDLTGGDSFPAQDMERAAEDVAKTVACASEIEERIRNRIRALVEKAIADGGEGDRRAALKEIFSVKLRGRRIWDSAQRVEDDNLVRRFRNLCEGRWQARVRLDAALAEIAELESMVVASSEVRSNAVINKLAVYGLPLSVCGNLLGNLIIVTNEQKFGGISWVILAGYALCVATGVAALAIFARYARKRWSIDKS